MNFELETNGHSIQSSAFVKFRNKLIYFLSVLLFLVHWYVVCLSSEHVFLVTWYRCSNSII